VTRWVGTESPEPRRSRPTVKPVSMRLPGPWTSGSSYPDQEETGQAMKKTEPGVGANPEKERASVVHAVAGMIRQSSEAGQLISESEILHRLIDQHLLTLQVADPEKEAESILQEAVEESQDLHEFADQEGSSHYYSSLLMTEPYARILHQKQINHLQLIAEIIRQDSAVYPRPVPLDMFTQPPFELTLHDVLRDLERMATKEEYGDIGQTMTSASRVFLYSTLHLEPEYASMLAEWFDVGQFDNP
jgi:hypothetical protein